MNDSIKLQLDVVAFSNLAQLHFIDKEVAHPLRDAMNESFPNLVGLVSRIKERAFQDWDDICSTLDLNAHLPKPVKETKDTKEGTGPAEKQPLPDEPEKGKVHSLLLLLPCPVHSLLLLSCTVHYAPNIHSNVKPMVKCPRHDQIAIVIFSVTLSFRKNRKRC